MVFLGDGMGKTIITGALNVGQPGMTTYNSATVGELPSPFILLTIFSYSKMIKLSIQLRLNFHKFLIYYYIHSILLVTNQ